MLGVATHLVLLRQMPHPLFDVASGSGVAQMACCLAVLVVSWRKPCSACDNAATMVFSDVMLLLGGVAEEPLLINLANSFRVGSCVATGGLGRASFQWRFLGERLARLLAIAGGASALSIMFLLGGIIV